MSYTPPSGSAVHFAVPLDILPIDFSFFDKYYSPPRGSSIAFNFFSSQRLLDFHWAMEDAPPISKELLSKLGLRFHGQVYKYWVGYVRLGTQCFRRHWQVNGGHTAHLDSWKLKFKLGVEAWHNLDDPAQLHWHQIGARKLKPITSLNAFLSAWMRDKV